MIEGLNIRGCIMMVCDKCGQESHVMTHTDEYPHLCDECYYADVPDSEPDVDLDHLTPRQLTV